MTEPSGWDYLTAGRYRKALALFESEYLATRESAVKFNIGITQLCLDDVEKAGFTFEELLQKKEPVDHSGLYAMSGIVQWIQGHYQHGVDRWERGLDCEYTDESGGLELPLLLYFASVRRPDVFAKNDARSLLQKRGKSAWAKNWPGPIGRFLLGKIDIAELRDKACDEDPNVERLQIAQVAFYFGVEAFREKQYRKFLEMMKECGSESKCEMLNEKYLAIYETRNKLFELTAGS